MDLQGPGKALLLLGLIIAGVGAVMMFAGRIPFLGKLPGDLSFRRGNVQVYVPIMTSVVLSIVLSVLLWLISHFRGK